VSDALLLLTWLTPLLAAASAGARGGRWLPGLAPLPALMTALTVPLGSQATFSWLLLGARLGLDATARIFLLFTAVLWLVAGLQAALTSPEDPHAARFRRFFLLSMAGNLWLVVSQDLVSFYLGFSLMGLAAYGLVIHRGDPVALRAGRVYMAMTLVAEVALFAGLLLIARHTGTLAPAPEQLAGLGDGAVGLLLLALGIKAGLVPLHLWLPLAHPAAPVPASAVLSGTMIKAALIGWIRFLPLGDTPLPGWGGLLVGAGAITVLYAIPVGLMQSHPKVILAYSSVGQMGLMAMLLGLALLEPAALPAAIAVLVFYAAHHGLAKGALFLGVGVAGELKGAWVMAVLALPALVLAGAPLTSGALAKGLVKPQFAAAQGAWAEALPLVLTLSTVGTTLLMTRFIWLVGGGRAASGRAPAWIAIPWMALIGAILGIPFVTDYAFPPAAESVPLLAGVLLGLVAGLWRPRWAQALVGLVPPGDMLGPLARLLAVGWRRLDSLSAVIRRTIETSRHALAHGLRPGIAWTGSAESPLLSWPVAGAVLLGLGAMLLLALSSPQP
jgi:formate hydrogenlyase subunit 3/multisubunit Na+/H+ antiporter MnhD subunit